jgi:hypothetical protein
MATKNSLETSSSHKNPLEQAIYNCLTQLFSEEEASIALKSWAHHTSGASSAFNGVNLFAREICNSLNQPEKHRELAKSLNRALIIQYSPSAVNKSPLHDFVEPKVSILSKAKKTNNIVSTTEPPQGNNSFLIFQLTIIEIIRQLTLLGGSTKSEAVAFLNEITETMPWSEIQQEQILALINNCELQPLRTYKHDQLQNFIKYLKAWISDKLGANSANQLFNQVIEHVAEREETNDFSLKNFLSS